MMFPDQKVRLVKSQAQCEGQQDEARVLVLSEARPEVAYEPCVCDETK